MVVIYIIIDEKMLSNFVNQAHRELKWAEVVANGGALHSDAADASAA